MGLRKFTEETFINLRSQKICCVEKSMSYLDELCGKYAVLDKIIGIVDENQRNRGSLNYCGRELAVYGMEFLTRIDRDHTVILILSDYHREIYQRLQMWLDNVDNDSCNSADIFYFENRETEIEMSYRYRYAKAALENMILFRSGPHASSYIKGMDFADNARALFEYALRIGLNEQYELVWLVKEPMEFERYKKNWNVSFVSFDWSSSDDRAESDAYYRALCLAKYIFFTDAYGFARNCRSDQIRIQLWHGCGFKTRVNFVPCENRYEYMTVISDLYADIHADIYGLRREQVIVTGYAKQDWLFHPCRDDLARLHIPKAGKRIFWLPTFRSTEHKLEQLNEYSMKSETGLPIVDTGEKLRRLNALLAEKKMILVVKLHPFQDRTAVHCDNCSNIHLIENEELARQDIPVNRLLAQADALISDYSSAAVDFMLLDRPIAFMLEDVEAYGKSRGFVFEDIRRWLPGKELVSFDDVCAFVGEVDEGRDPAAGKRQALRDRMHKYCDDGNCRRILEAFDILPAGTMALDYEKGECV